MNRLTYKNSDAYDSRHATACINKLGQLEDIEEELDIDLATLFKALKNGVYFKYIFIDKHSGIIELIEFSDFVDICYDPDTNEWFIDIKGQSHNTTKNYGKTWALTKEELIHEIR